MSEGQDLPLFVAEDVAQRLVEQLRPLVRRVEVAGSIRRRREIVRDMELVAEPQMHRDLFGGETALVAPIHALCREWGELAKAGDRYVQVWHAEERVKVDLFLVHPPAQWGVILAIRTGPAELGQWAVTRMRDRGYRCIEGHIERVGPVVPGERVQACDTEAQFFAYAGLPCLDPKERDTAAARKPLEASA